MSFWFYCEHVFSVSDVLIFSCKRFANFYEQFYRIHLDFEDKCLELRQNGIKFHANFIERFNNTEAGIIKKIYSTETQFKLNGCIFSECTQSTG